MKTIRIIGLILIAQLCFNSCSSSADSAKNNDTMRVENHFVADTGDDLYLSSYYLSVSDPFTSKHAVLAYNQKCHAIDSFDEEGFISSLQLQREGPDGIPERVVGMLTVSDSLICLADRYTFYLIDRQGHVVMKYAPSDISIVDRNYAVNNSAFGYLDNRYLAFPAFDVANGGYCIVIHDMEGAAEDRHVQLNLPESNPDGTKNFAYYQHPHVSFSGSLVIYNYGYDSHVYTVNLQTEERNQYSVPSRFTDDVLPEFEGTGDFSAMQRYQYGNPHFMEVFYVPEADEYVRLILQKSDISADTDDKTIVDSKQLCLTYLDSSFNVIDEIVLPEKVYNNFNGWCVLPDCILLYRDNALAEKSAEGLDVDLIFHK